MAVESLLLEKGRRTNEIRILQILRMTHSSSKDALPLRLTVGYKSSLARRIFVLLFDIGVQQQHRRSMQSKNKIAGDRLWKCLGRLSWSSLFWHQFNLKRKIIAYLHRFVSDEVS
jgi:hypothetical protein